MTRLAIFDHLEIIMSAAIERASGWWPSLVRVRCDRCGYTGSVVDLDDNGLLSNVRVEIERDNHVCGRDRSVPWQPHSSPLPRPPRMSITDGDILTADVEALVNPVNTVGVMGAGLAAQVKHTFPDVFQQYRAACEARELHTGIVIAHHTGTNPRYIISFPTKQHWRDKSKLEWIDMGLISLRETIEDLGIRSIAIPALGCGLGGLSWTKVRAVIGTCLGDLAGVDVVLYPPH